MKGIVGDDAGNHELQDGVHRPSRPLLPAPWWRSGPYSGIKPGSPPVDSFLGLPAHFPRLRMNLPKVLCNHAPRPAQKAPVAKSGWQMITFIDSEMLIQMDKKSLQQDKQVKDVDQYSTQEDKQRVNKHLENSSAG